MNKFLFTILALAFVAGGALYSCSGGGGGAGIIAVHGNGKVGLYLTDAPMDTYSQVTATVERVQLLSSGTGTNCDLLGTPVSVNISNMAGINQLVDVTQCPAGPYNRFRMQFDQAVSLMSGTTGTTPFPCSFTSYMNQGQGNPNKLACDGSGICTLDITGTVNVLARQDSKVALDFDLKNFIITNPGTPACSVTMKVHPLTQQQMTPVESVTGLVSNLSTTDMTFDLITRGIITFNVDYSGISNSVQPDLGLLLQRAEDEQLLTQVTASTIDLSTNAITASKIEVKIAGVVSNLTTTTFSLSYGTMGSIVVDYGNAFVSGTLADGSWVLVKLIGHDQTSGDFIADKVEVGLLGTMTEN